MPEADTFDAPQGGTLYGRLFEGVTESLVGNGITNHGDAEVTHDTGMVIEVAGATNLSYGGESYNPSTTSFNLPAGPSSTTNGVEDRRADLVYFNSDTGGYGVVEGDPHPNPEPPSTPADGLLLAVVFVPHDTSTLDDDYVLNWRPIRVEGGADIVIDSDDFDSTTVEGALHELLDAIDAVGLSTLADHDIDGNTVVDGATTVYDDGIVHGVVGALSEFGADDTFTGYPLSLTDDTDFEVVASGTFTHTAGDTTEFTIPGVTEDETAVLDVSIHPASAAQIGADYAYNVETSRRWDENNGEVFVDVVVVWDTDPGGMNDLQLEYEITTR